MHRWHPLPVATQLHCREGAGARVVDIEIVPGHVSEMPDIRLRFLASELTRLVALLSWVRP
jgi:hypothetical protein